MSIMHFVRYMNNSRTLLSWSLRRDAFKPRQCFIDKNASIPMGIEGVCECVKYCKHSPPPQGALSNVSFQTIDDVVYSLTPLKNPPLNKEVVVQYL